MRQATIDYEAPLVQWACLATVTARYWANRTLCSAGAWQVWGAAECVGLPACAVWWMYGTPQSLCGNAACATPHHPTAPSQHYHCFMPPRAFQTSSQARLQNCEKLIQLRVRPSAWDTSASTERNFMKFDYFFFRKSVEEVRVSLKSDKNNRQFT